MKKATKSILILSKKTVVEKKEKAHSLSSGSTLLNLACTNSPFGAFIAGKYVFFVGDSTSGKTFLAMTCCAEALRNPFFKNYRLIYDNVEDGCLLDLETLFNKEVAQRITPPSMDKAGNPIYSYTIEEFYYNLDDALTKAKEDKQPVIYILDSMDSLSSTSEEGKFLQHKKALKKGTVVPGSYGDGKAKRNSEGLRKVMKGLRDTGSILIIICQTRDSLGFGFETKTHAGGHALRFYATHEIWTSLGGRIKRNVHGKDRTIGIHSIAKVKKNRATGELHEVMIDIYPSYGVDDIGGCIDFLVAEGQWKKDKQSINATDFAYTGTREGLIRHIESKGLYRKLQILTGNCWKEIRDATKINRKKRYEVEA